MILILMRKIVKIQIESLQNRMIILMKIWMILVDVAIIQIKIQWTHLVINKDKKEVLVKLG